MTLDATNVGLALAKLFKSFVCIYADRDLNCRVSSLGIQYIYNVYYVKLLFPAIRRQFKHPALMLRIA